MAFNVFSFLAIMFLVGALAAAGALVYVQLAKKKPIVGAMVRTTFTGNPAVLTTALWGQGKSVTSLSYGLGYDQDSSNALHCDVFGGYGTFSTWVSNGGLDFKKNPWIGSATRMYFGTSSCSVDTDCSVTRIHCGPGETLWNAASVNGNKAASQCPGNSYCNLCGPLPTDKNYSTYCSGLDSAAIGSCVNAGANYPLQCMESPGGIHRCAAYVPTSPTSPMFTRATPCSTTENYTSICSNIVSSGGNCFTNPDDSCPFYCKYYDVAGNVVCPNGQTCVVNTSSLSGWCPPVGCTGYPTASNICEGPIYPNISLNTQWIAEGRVVSVNGTTSNIAWERVQNTYPGIGPSPLYLNTDTRGEASGDLNWVYSDCRFIKSSYSGNVSVSNALLGTDVTSPNWSYIHDTYRTRATENLLHIGGNLGSIASPQRDPYFRSAWNLRSVNVPNSQLERIWFFSIHPMQNTPEVAHAVSLHLT